MPTLETLTNSLPASLTTTTDGFLSKLTQIEGQPFFASLSMIIVSELGDKTFLIAALMAMRHDRLVVFCAAFAALLIMSVLSGLLGHTMPALLPKHITQIAACGLFFIFGVKMCWEGYKMDKNASVDEELAEVEHELSATGLDDPSRRIEEGGLKPAAQTSATGHATLFLKGCIDGVVNLMKLMFSPVFVQTFTLTFLGEWGDRSQIATIAMAAGSDYWWVIIGTVLGHSLCTVLAVMGGRLLARKISIKQVTLGGGILFLIFGVLYMM